MYGTQYREASDLTTIYSQAAYSSILSGKLARQAQGENIEAWVKEAEGIYADAREIE